MPIPLPSLLPPSLFPYPPAFPQITLVIAPPVPLSMGLTPNPPCCPPTLIPSLSAKYFGSYITPTSNSIPDVVLRCSQVSNSSSPSFGIHLSPQKRNTNLFPIINSIILHGTESQVFSPARTAGIDSGLPRNFPSQKFLLPSGTKPFWLRMP